MERALAKLYFQAVVIEKTVRDAHVPEVEELEKSGQEKRVGKYHFAPLYSEVFIRVLVFQQESTPLSGGT